MKLLLTFATIIGVVTILLAGCAGGLCVNQASCPDGSWSVTGSGSFSDVAASTMHRIKTAVQLTLTQERELGASGLPAGYRKVPLIGNDITPTPGDDDGYAGGAVTYGGRPSVVCGTTQTTIEARIADCASLNSSVATWDGSVSGNSGQGQWKLVTYNGTHEVWRDERTKLIWSDSLGTAYWCRATGSSGGGPYAEVDQYNICDNATYQNQVTPESLCTEDPGLSTSGTYDSMKGGMRLTETATSPSITWRLPTIYDYKLADVNGIRFPLPNMGVKFWTSTLSSATRNFAWDFSGTNGNFDDVLRTSATRSIRCVGR